MQWAIFLAEKLNKANKICLPQHVLDLVLLEQQVDRIFIPIALKTMKFVCYNSADS